MEIDKPTWKTTLYPHGSIGHVSKMYEYARSIGYPFFVWNGWVYRTSDTLQKVCLEAEIEA